MNKYLIAGICALCFGAGWTVNGYRLNVEIADLQKEKSDETAAKAAAALDKFTAAANVISGAAESAKLDNTALFSKLNAIHKGMTNAKPLPVDCKPDAIRLQSLKDAVRATNDATARSVSKK